MSGLPRGWEKIKLKELFGQTRSIEPSAHLGEVFELYSVPSFSEGRPEIVPGSSILSNKQIVQTDDVLLCKIVPHLNRVWSVSRNEGHRQIASGEWIVLRNHGCEPRYLQTCLSEQSFRNEFMKTVSGVGGSLMRARPVSVAEIAIPVAPAAEQSRIVTKINRLSIRSKLAREELEWVERRIEKYKQALLASVFCQDRGGLSSSAEDFSPRLLSDVVLSTFYGPRIAAKAYVSDGVPTLRTTDISDWGRLVPREPPRVSVSAADLSKWRLHDGDLIVTRTGATIGKCAMYEDKLGPALPSAYLIRVRINKVCVLPRFVVLFLLSPSGQEQLLAGRTATAQPNINAKAILSVRLPIPSITTQHEIVRRIEHAFAAIDRLAVEAQSARALLDKLDQAILAKAFRGELVPQDPNDEPASVLLEGIRAERGATPAKPRGQKRKAKT